MWGSALLNYAYIPHGALKTHACFNYLFVFVATVLFVGRGFAPKYVYILHGTLKNTCVFSTFAYWCILFRLWGLALLTNMLIFCVGPSKRLAVTMLSIFMGEFKLKSYVFLLVW